MQTPTFVSLLAAALACAALPLAAQEAPPSTPGLLRVAAAPDGTVLSLDSASIAHLAEATYAVTAVYQYSPALAQQYGFDRLLEAQEVDCQGTRERPLWKQAYRGDALQPVRDDDAGPREWMAVGEDELPLLQAICGTLRQSFAASLPLEYDLEQVETAPSLANVLEVQRGLSHEYPRDLRDRGISGSVSVRMRVLPDGQVDRGSVQIQRATEPAFAGAAVRVAAVMRFTPARVDGKPVAVWVTVPIEFQVLGNSRPAAADDPAFGRTGAAAAPRAVRPPKGSPSLCSVAPLCPVSP
ncbi:MAG TPA: TonB family protein [Longimicrobium sp.]|jgi:TonB family protein